MLKNLNCRYATKSFNPAKKVSGQDLEKLKEAIRLSVSSYGVQLYKVLSIDNRQLKEKLRVVSSGQHQIKDCAHLFVFCNFTDVKSKLIDDYIQLKAEVQEPDPESLTGYAEFMKAKLSEKPEAEKMTWLKMQPYLALSNLLMACAELKIDACPMDGFEPNKYNHILEFTDRGLNAVVIAAVGYRSGEDLNQSSKKVRKPATLLFEQI
ncbi:NAD(P)H-dependent oxidoreductase [Dyadobacter arcticus]|uniref:Nitroreductase n=1 Tax=Dyadobacter arcticus TaxID=1078754 RepID=A0ABX0UWX8_9BACT|nr:NAD(P)H-dependent oxidoreductase [Dyadobacter arcticus]NIJ56110.1 nitroreductase [Dyadobacter arcticus]